MGDQHDVFCKMVEFNKLVVCGGRRAKVQTRVSALRKTFFVQGRGVTSSRMHHTKIAEALSWGCFYL